MDFTLEECQLVEGGLLALLGLLSAMRPAYSTKDHVGERVKTIRALVSRVRTYSETLDGGE